MSAAGGLPRARPVTRWLRQIANGHLTMPTDQRCPSLRFEPCRLQARWAEAGSWETRQKPQ